MGEERGRPRSRRRHAVLAAVGILAAVGLAASCTGSGSSDGGAGPPNTSDTIATEGPPQAGGRVVVGVTNDTNGWNPHDNQWAGAGSLVGSSVLEPLVTLDGNLDPVPWLATAWTPNATFDSYTIELRDGVTFHDGTPFDAAAVKVNLDDVKTAALTGLVWRGILGDVTVVDPRHVRVDLTAPFAAFPTSFLSGQTGLMMAPSMFGAEGRGTRSPVGTGPFVFASWTVGSSFEATRNARYWQDGQPYLDEIEFVVVGDSAAQATALQSGDVDLVFTAAISTVEQVPDTFTILEDWTSEPGMVITNTIPEVDGRPNPMANRHARLALAYATDRQALADSVGAGVVTPNSPFPADRKWGMAPEDNGYVEFDVAKAREEVAAYQADTGQPLSFTLSAPTGTDVGKVVQLLQGQWADAGITVGIDSVEATSFISDVVSGKYEAAIFNIYGSPDPDQNHHFWAAETANGTGAISINFTQFTSPTMEANLEIGRESNDFATRKAAYDAIVREINGAAVNIWTFSTPYSMIANPRIHGLAKVAAVPFGNYQPKTWLADLWVSE